MSRVGVLERKRTGGVSEGLERLPVQKVGGKLDGGNESSPAHDLGLESSAPQNRWAANELWRAVCILNRDHATERIAEPGAT